MNEIMNVRFDSSHCDYSKKTSCTESDHHLCQKQMFEGVHLSLEVILWKRSCFIKMNTCGRFCQGFNSNFIKKLFWTTFFLVKPFSFATPVLRHVIRVHLKWILCACGGAQESLKRLNLASLEAIIQATLGGKVMFFAKVRVNQVASNRICGKPLKTRELYMDND